MSLLDSILNSRPFGDQRGNGATSIPRAAGSTSESRRCPVSGGAFRCAWVPVLAGCAVLGTALAEVEVTTIFDENNGSLNPALGTGTSLREAVVHAPAGSTIVFAPAVYGQTITLISGQLLITKNLVIDASTSPTGVTVSGNENSRVFDIQPGTTLSMRAVHVIDGAVSGDGGGIRNAGTLALQECELASNEAGDGGGAIENTGTLSLTACTLVANSASVGGGAIEHASGVLTLTNCTLTANSAQWGGGIDGDGTSTIRLYSCTVTGNQASDKGGGIEETTGTLLLENSIVAGNTAPNSGPDIKASSISTQLGVNLISSTNGFSGGFSGIVASPQLEALGDYGGRTWTMPPKEGSPAIDAGGTTALLVDQRGLPRVVGPAVDIGAVEVQPTLVVTNDDDAGPGSLRDTVAIAPPNALITFAPSLDDATILLTGGAVALDKSLTLDASERLNLAVSANNASGIFTVNAGTVVRVVGLGTREGGGQYGGAVHNAGNLTLERCPVWNSQSYQGGAIFNAAGAVLEVTDCELTGNFAYFGGSIHNAGTAVLARVVVDDSFSEEEGGAVWNDGSLTADESVFSRGTAYFFGGAIYSTGALSLTRCAVTGNWAADSGGGIYGHGTLNACSISGNSCIGSGGGLSGTFSLTNCTVAGNDAVFEGGGIAHFSGSSQVVSCTIAGNHSDLEGGGIYTTLPGQLTLVNSIVAGNSAPLGPDFSGTITTQGGVNLLSSTAGLTGGFAGIVADPLLGPLAINGGPTLTMLPQPGSPAIDAGGPTALVFDQRGLARVVGAKVDIGAVETGNAIPTIIVNTSFDETDGIGFGDISLRDAMTDGAPGTTIHFAPALAGQTITLTAGPLVVAKNLVIDASPLAGVLTITGSAGPAFDIGAARSALLKGLTIADIIWDEFDEDFGGNGAAIRNLAGYLEVQGCTLADNVATNGGAVYNHGSLAMTDCTIIGNESTNDGGAILNRGSARLTRCQVVGNGSSGNAGAIHNLEFLVLSECTVSGSFSNVEGGGLLNELVAVIERCTFSGNTSEAGIGGGVSNHGSLTVTNSTFTGNEAQEGIGGGIRNSGTLSVISCTISGNHAGDEGGGIITFAPGQLTLENSIIAGNTAGDDGPDLLGAILSQLGVNLLGSTEGVTVPFTGIVADPLLAPLSDNGGPTLTMLPQPGSPAIDAGGPTSLTVDQRGFPRVQGGTLDIGSVEITAASPGLVVNTTVDENNGSAVGNVSLREAIAESPPGSVITFAPSVNAQVILLTAGTLVIGKDLTIDASSLLAVLGVSGNSRFRVFDIAPGSTVSMRHLSIVDGRVTSDGGGIRNAGHLTLTDCEVFGCSTGDDGAGIYNSGSLVLKDSRVTDNIAADSGGGIASQGPVSLLSCVVSSNNADNGGGIYNDGAVLTIEDCTLGGNTVDNSPGGGAIDNDGGEVAITRSTLAGNSSVTGGGAIENDGPLTILACTLSGNTAAVGGGAIEHTAGVLEITSSTLAENSAKWGGAIDGDGTSTIRLNCCTVSANHASDKGGGIEETTGTLVLENTIVGGNTAVSSGPDLKATSINQQLGVNLISSTNGLGGSFAGIVAAPMLSALANWGGPTETMVPLTGSPAIDAGEPTPLTVDQRGLPRLDGGWVDIGAVEVQNYLLVTTAGDSGAGSLRTIVGLARSGSTIPFAAFLDGETIALTSEPIVFGKDLTIDASMLPNGVIFTGTAARAFGVTDGSEVAMKRLTITGFVSPENDGAAIHNAGQLELVGCTLTGNYGEDGGAIHNADGGWLAMTECTVTDNEAQGDGGGLFNEGEAELVDCLVSGNGTFGNGAGIANTGLLTLTTSTFSLGFANTSGGGLFNDVAGSAYLDRCEFSENVAESGYGGGLLNAGYLYAADSAIDDNEVWTDGEGGGILNTVVGELELVACSVSGNHAGLQGGGIANDFYLLMYQCTVAGNTCDGDGGGMHAEGIGFTLLNSCTVSGNTAEENGGGLYHLSGDMVIINSTIAANEAADDSGGGIRSDDGTLELVSCTIAGNQAANEGGGAYAATGAELSMENTIIAGNVALVLGPDLRGAITSESGVNLLGSTAGVTSVFAGIVGNPLLGPLTDNGGPTLTMLPQAGSPAINSGGATALTVDQRGFTRVVGGTVDIGSVETGNPIPP